LVISPVDAAGIANTIADSISRVIKLEAKATSHPQAKRKPPERGRPGG